MAANVVFTDLGTLVGTCFHKVGEFQGQQQYQGSQLRPVNRGSIGLAMQHELRWIGDWVNWEGRTECRCGAQSPAGLHKKADRRLWFREHMNAIQEAQEEKNGR